MNAYEFMKRAGELTSRNQQRYIDYAKKHGINYNTLGVLYTCYVNKGCTQKRVTVEWNIPKQTVNNICKELISKGLLKKEKGINDHRESMISLTGKGEKFASPIVEKLLAIENGIVESLGGQGAADFLQKYKEYSDIFVREFDSRLV